MICLTPDCDNPTFCRQLCKRCYDRVQKRIKRGTLSWGELIEKGLASRSKNAGASTANRREGQSKKSKAPRNNPWGLSKIQLASMIADAKKKLENPSGLPTWQLQACRDTLSLAGELYDS